MKRGVAMDDRIVYDGWLKVVQRTVNGKVYDILKDHDAVSAIIVNENNEILLVKQFRPALLETTLEIPAGTLDNKEESEIDCLLRELKEETGISFSNVKIEHVFSYKPMMGFSNSLMKVYLIRTEKERLISSVIHDEDVYEAKWVGIEEIGEKILSGEILDVKVILAYYYLKASCNV